MGKNLTLIDGHAIAYRSYYALTSGTNTERWHTSQGEPTAGIFGFSSILLSLLEKDRPDYLVIAFDTGKTFRNDLFEGYKATRAKMPDDLRPQIDRMRELADSFRIPRLELEGFEADDILGSLAFAAAEQGYQVKIITGDRDLLQLVNSQVTVKLAGSKLSDSVEYSPAMVKDFLGIPPELVVDYKALVGDPSDNYPGVPGVGPKTAVKLLEDYGSLDGIYENLSLIKDSIRMKLESHKEDAYLSRTLAKIRTDLKLTIDFHEASTEKLNFRAVEELFKTLEFKVLLPRLKAIAPSFLPADHQLSFFEVPDASDSRTDIETYSPQFQIIDDEEELKKLIQKLNAAELIGLDTETTGIDAMSCRLVGISLSVEPGKGFYIPVGHVTGEKQLPLSTICDALRPILQNPKIGKAGHNIKFDALVLKNHGLDISGIVFDSMIAGWVIDPTSKNLGLKPMAESLLGIKMTMIQSLIGKGKEQRTMAEVSVQDVAPYASADAEVVLQLMPILQKKLQELGTAHILTEMEIPLIPVLIEMEYNGIKLDASFLKEMSKKLAIRLNEIEEEIYQLVGYRFNINSTQQLSRVLFETLRLPQPSLGKKTVSGHFSTAADVLEEMQGIHPVIDLILENRELSKLKSTYVDALPSSMNPVTHRIHTSFNQTGTVTGRLASAAPNLQNIPTRTELGRQVRTAFVADQGKVLLSVDYSQIELRIVAHMAQDEGMLSAFRANQDIHAATAAAIYNCDIHAVTKEMRRHAKAINFGLLYGMNSFGLSRSAKLSRKDASDFVAAYYARFPGVKRFLDGIRVQAANDGYVETMMGRKRYFPGLGRQMNHLIRDREEREAINAPVQGTAADILKIAMIRLPSALDQAGLKSKILLQVHDELLLECASEELDETRKIVQSVMESAVSLSIPLLTEARSGINWGALTTVEN